MVYTRRLFIGENMGYYLPDGCREDDQNAPWNEKEPDMENCEECDGDGYVGEDVCESCDGLGQVEVEE